MISNWHKIPFKSDLVSTPINRTEIKITSVFAQNPSYAYLFSSFGIFIAKLLNLTEV